MQFETSNRVRDRKWGGVYTGTITRVDTPADLAERRAEDPDDDGTLYVYVRWDGTSFTEDQLEPSEVELIDGTGDPEVGYAVFRLPVGQSQEFSEDTMAAWAGHPGSQDAKYDPPIGEVNDRG